jgi:hypothetical protein
MLSSTGSMRLIPEQMHSSHLLSPHYVYWNYDEQIDLTDAVWLPFDERNT